MSSEHSPGPWTLTPDSFVMSGSKPSVGVARIICHAQGFPANGRLICAAPDLLEAHDVALGHLILLRKAILAGDPKDELLQRTSDLMDLHSAVIAKAEGR